MCIIMALPALLKQRGQRNFEKPSRYWIERVFQFLCQFQEVSLHKPPLKRLSFLTTTLLSVFISRTCWLNRLLCEQWFWWIPCGLLCSEELIYGLLSTFDTSKSSDPDNISARMLKCTGVSIAPAVASLFNHSLQLGKVPHEWKNPLPSQFLNSKEQIPLTHLDQYLFLVCLAR